MYNLNDFFTEILLHLLGGGARLGRGWGEWGSLRRHLQLGHGAWEKNDKVRDFSPKTLPAPRNGRSLQQKENSAEFKS